MEISYDDAGSLTETERDSIENSISTIAETPYGTAPFIRGMGVRNYPPASASDIDRNRYATEVITQCGLWEDRAGVSSISFNDNGKVRMVIKYGRD
jgi:phage baseplate assembly protein W